MLVKFGLQLDSLTSSVGREQESKAKSCRFDPGFIHNLFFSVKVVGAHSCYFSYKIKLESQPNFRCQDGGRSTQHHCEKGSTSSTLAR